MEHGKIVTYNKGNYGAKDYRARVIGEESGKIVLQVFYPGRGHRPAIEHVTTEQIKPYKP